ncbi:MULTISPECIES: SycD/LcrH family type III secretion system chaperone [Dyella]|uniref:CesD/SycD/LcrH family type III secretion system chaperone n=2 Tax=Dyella TaxID=231454 RepID=A0A4R0YW36_9GAMM|nr:MULTISPECIES: SycD/LcrH family type III secretion system chaperone [Dyella]TBR38734.1 CesD/SycD/LcrH family type III secretion system chaperone [Dyella terrae]TCI13675.1 CesD/SycD/LcrH family type III secretion system chaperone [Dyella soli]
MQPNAETQLNDEHLVESLAEAVMAGGTLKDACGISDEAMEGVYAYAYRFYRDGQLDEAERFFRFLCLYDFYNSEYALGLAAVYHLKKNYRKAIDLYSLAFSLGPDDYRALFHIGQCHVALKKIHAASEAFEMVVRQSSNDELKAQSTTYLDAIKSMLSGKEQGEGQS